MSGGVRDDAKVQQKMMPRCAVHWGTYGGHAGLIFQALGPADAGHVRAGISH
jgi:hypothetical protein